MARAVEWREARSPFSALFRQGGCVSLERDSRLGRYTIRQRLAGGGMGVVYRARDELLGREVALKTILSDKAMDKHFLSRFRREALSIAQINHPNIVSLIDFVEGDPAKGEISYMVMEYLKGKDLGKVIKETGPLEMTRAVDRVLEVCAAVGTCHRRGYLHRDLKPTNIFLTEYDHIESAKVLDFGVAKMWAEKPEAEAANDLEELTRKGMVFGTPEYLAPELMRGKPATPKADQYAIGVVLYTALTGTKPFKADPKADVPDLDLWQAVAKGEHPKPRALRQEIPEGLEEAIERAIRLNPDHRFLDVQELGAALLEWASAAARHRWTAHFTSAPPEPVKTQTSIADDGTTQDSIPRPLAQRTASTVASNPNHRKTRPVGSGELRLAAGEVGRAPGEIDVATTARQEGAPVNVDAPGGELPSQSLPIAVEEPAPGDEPLGSASTISPAHRPTVSEILRRPKTLIVAGAAVLAAAVIISAALHGKKPAPLPASAPPPELFEQRPKTPSPAPAATAPSDSPPAAPSAPSPSTPGAALAPPVVPGVKEAVEHKRPIQKRKKVPAVDQKGFPIPSE